MDFVPFPKIKRLTREMIVTEKLDGTNAQITITEDGGFYIGSRTRWITPEDDNYGFARWATEHKDELMQLGPGSHFGEWWGQGIQRKYSIGEKRWSLFNTTRWNDPDKPPIPACCHVVPILYRGEFDTAVVAQCLERLRTEGSVASPGFMNPEGVVVFHMASGSLFKKTILKDEEPKGISEHGAAMRDAALAKQTEAAFGG